jgi:DNA (cytosine-5)-methyltransferase 3A
LILLNVLSCFDGISCGQVALERVGIKVDNYYASEIDKYAIKVTQHNYPNTIQLGDIREVKGCDLPKIDLLIGGSPCQGFSFSGKQLNFNDPRSKLFFEYVRLLKEVNPKYFLLENVVMKKEYQDIISEHLGVQPIEINSSLVSGQNRRRLYWTNITNIKQPEDKNINLQDILEEDVTEEFFIKGKYFEWLEKNKEYNTKKKFCSFNPKKSIPLMARMYAPWRGNFIEYPAAIRGRTLNKATILGRRLNSDGHRDAYNKNIPITQCLEVRKTNTNKSNCLTTVTKDNVLTILPPGRHEDVYNKYMDGVHYRKLTPIECERLQTLPNNYTSTISNSQRYKCLGNGWTVDVISHILKHIKHFKNKA